MNSRRAEKTTAAERTENMIEKIKYWLFQKGKDCKRCCLRSDITIYAAGTYWEMWDYKARKQ